MIYVYTKFICFVYIIFVNEYSYDYKYLFGEDVDVTIGDVVSLTENGVVGRHA